MKSKKSFRRRLPLLIGGIFFLILVVGVVILIKKFLDNPDKPNTRRVQQISLIKPPEPPPPPPPEEKPPEVKEEVKIDEPPPPAEAPPPGANLGLDADGNGNGDSFGLIGNKGGRELTLGGFGSRFGGYLGGMQKSIRDELARNEKLRKGEYKAVVAIWISQDGRVERFELLGSSGEPVVDAALKKVLGSIRQFDEPPSDMPQPVKLRISSRWRFRRHFRSGWALSNRIVRYTNNAPFPRSGSHKFRPLAELPAIRPGWQTALHSHSAKSPKVGDISRWLTPARLPVICGMFFAGFPLDRRPVYPEPVEGRE